MFSFQALFFRSACWKRNCLAPQKVFITAAETPLRFSVTKLLVANNIPHKLISQHLIDSFSTKKGYWHDPFSIKFAFSFTSHMYGWQHSWRSLVTSEVAGYQTWGDRRGIGARGGGWGEWWKAGCWWCVQPPHSRPVTRRVRLRLLPRYKSLPIYLRVSFYFYLHSVCFPIYVLRRFVVTIGSDVVIFTVPFAAGAGIS